MIAYILIFFAAIFNAAMDRLENDVAFNRSIFNHLDPKFWLKSVSWQYVKFLPFTKYRADGWHICKSAMIVLLIAAIFFGKHLPELNMPFIGNWWHFVFLGATWNVTFNLFYNRIMKR